MKLPPVSVRGDSGWPVSLDAPPREVRVGVMWPIPSLEGLEELGEVVAGPVAEYALGLLDRPVGKSPHPHQLPEVCSLLLDQIGYARVALHKEALGLPPPLA